MKWLLVTLLAASSAMDWYRQANSLFAEGKYAEAEVAIENALKLDPKLVPALTLKAKFAMGFSQFDTARECLLQAADLAPESPYVQFLLGFFYYVDNDFSKALEPLGKALELEPGNSRAMFYLAMTKEGLGQGREAIPLYEETLRLESAQGQPQVDTLVAYARLMYVLGDLAKSEELAAAALKLDVDSRDVQYEMGRLLYEKRDYPAAIAHGERSLALPGVGTTDRQIHFLLARAYRRAGDMQRAEEHLQKFRASGASLRR